MQLEEDTELKNNEALPVISVALICLLPTVCRTETHVGPSTPLFKKNNNDTKHASSETQGQIVGAEEI